MSTALTLLSLLSPIPILAGESRGTAAEDPEAQVRARTIAASLERGQVSAAASEADAAVKRFPGSRLLWKRAAQSHMCEALRLDGELSAVAQRAFLGKHLETGVQWLLALSDEERERIKLSPEHLERLRAVAQGEQVTGFTAQARKQFVDSAATIDLRTKALVAAHQAIGRARNLGSSDTELDLTDLWRKFVVLFFRKQVDKLRSADPKGSDRLTEVERSLASFDGISGEALLHEAAMLAKSRSTDPVAVAGAADLIDLLAVLEGRSRPLQKHSASILTKRYLRNAAAVNPERTKEAREAARQQYSQSRNAETASVLSVPGTVSIQLYERALAVDKQASLPYLQQRVTLLRAAFVPEEAGETLEVLRKKELRNGAFLLEQVRVSLLLNDDVNGAVEQLRQSTRVSEFDRSALVAVPGVLRSSLNSHPAMQTLMKDFQPGYSWLFDTLVDTQASQKGAAAKLELRLLRLRIAELLCKAQDSADQAEGIHHKSLVLAELLGLPDLTPQQRAVLQLQEEEHLRTFHNFPRAQTFAVLSLSGLDYSEYPRAGGRGGAEGPQLWAGGAGAWVLFPNVQRKAMGAAR